ncbi:hypothetical protein JVT61DRAFT_2878 [Boletus reticuloceps]|uniref:Uncharacterized protein n=1 Tax=Boletus reticuloceps TaxID=495285 RepID=A0A8I2YNP3_9AGAM|nr:hypothetical protein JVT61DRAFT_2878 [Boletus reticuloceps]
MAKYSLPHIQYALTINPWHHIQITWKCKFKCAMEHIVEMDETENMDALGHTCGTENHIYGLSTHSLAGAAEDASTSWQEHCRVPVGGHPVPYDQAKEPSKDTSSSTANAMQDQPGSTSTSKFSRPAISVNLKMDRIADKVVECLTPMLTNIMQSINRL